MSQVFDTYALYYDLLYRDKDYSGEAKYVSSHIRKHAPQAKQVLELGCGTGVHAEHLVRLGYTVHGVDMSEGMLVRAEDRKALFPPEMAARLSFELGDVRTVRTGATYDTIISLFHVLSYQTTNDDLQATFATASVHLQPGGLFIFDFWYGPAVLSDPPTVRIKRLGDNENEMLRIAEPEMHYNDNLVDVNYQVLITEKETGKVEQILEKHKMRYLFMPEIKGHLSAHGFQLLKAEEWLSGKSPGSDTWGVCCVARFR